MNTWFAGYCGRFQSHSPDVQVFFETIRLEQVGEFQNADVAPAFADYRCRRLDAESSV